MNWLPQSFDADPIENVWACSVEKISGPQAVRSPRSIYMNAFNVIKLIEIIHQSCSVIIDNEAIEQLINNKVLCIICVFSSIIILVILFYHPRFCKTHWIFLM